MKVSKRDITLLILLAIIGLAYILYTLLFKPLIAEIDTANANLETIMQQKTALDNSISRLDKLKSSQEKAIDAAISNSAIYLPDLTNSKIANFIGVEATKFGLTVASVNLSDPAVVDTTIKTSSTNLTLSYPLGALANQIQQSTSSGSAVTVTSSEVSSQTTSGSAVSGSADKATAPAVVQVKAQITISNTTYANIMALLKDIEGMHRAIYLDSISLQAQQGSNLLSAIIILDFTEIQKVNNTDTGLSLPPVYPSAGKADPFS